MTREDIRGIYLISDALPDMLKRARSAIHNGVKVVPYRGKVHARRERLSLAVSTHALEEVERA